MTLADQGIINHFAMVLDRSGSMSRLQQKVVQVADTQVAHLASRSTEMDQETRATVYQFGHTTENLYYDKDVLRLPSLQGKYIIDGDTALVDATMQAVLDLEKTATLYGDHAFLIYVLTDGMENASRRYTQYDMREKFNKLPDNWTIAALVPNAYGVNYAKGLGFPTGNIAIWDTTVEGLGKAANVVQQATENFMQARATGVRGTRNLFTLDPAKVKTDKLIEIDKRGYKLLPVLPTQNGMQIRDFVIGHTGQPYKKGMAYYELTKKEEVQPQKQLVVLDNKKNVIYSGPDARQMLGLPNDYVDVQPKAHPNYTIFVQSTSVNRKLVPGTRVLVF